MGSSWIFICVALVAIQVSHSARVHRDKASQSKAVHIQDVIQDAEIEDVNTDVEGEGNVEHEVQVAIEEENGNANVTSVEHNDNGHSDPLTMHLPKGIEEAAAHHMWPMSVGLMSIRYEKPELLDYGIPAQRHLRLNEAQKFADVWKAHDKLGGRDVVIKMFPLDDINYAWSAVPAAWRAHAECHVLNFLHGHSSLDPVAASRIPKCLEDHTDIHRSTSKKKGNIVQHTVLSYRDGMAMREMLNGWKVGIQFEEERKKDAEPNSLLKLAPNSFLNSAGRLGQARDIVVQILQVLRFLSKTEPKIIHKGVQPDNVRIKYVDVSEDARYSTPVVELVGWGNAMPHERQNDTWRVPKESLLWKPPEAKKYHAFSEPWHSYDVFSTGVLYLQLMCRGTSKKGLMYTDELRKIINKNHPELHPGKEEQWKDHMKKSFFKRSDRCPLLLDDEIDLILAMLGPAKKRPKPVDALAHIALRGNYLMFLKNSRSKFWSEGTDASPKLHLQDITAYFDEKSMQNFKMEPGTGSNQMQENQINQGTMQIKCCCNAKEGECKRVSLESKCRFHHDPLEHGLYALSPSSCRCHLGQDWRQFRKGPLNQCLVKDRSVHHLKK